jgi:hypothetical protein
MGYGSLVKPSVYVENSVVSYLTARRAEKNDRVAGHQDITREWWNVKRHQFDLYASAVVVKKAQDGDANAAAARLEVIAQLTLLEVSEEARARGYEPPVMCTQEELMTEP